MFDGPIRGGTRGGQGEFKWSDVSADKDRENYLGHSINAPTGRWQKNKDVHWYNRDLKSGEAERLEEIRKIKEAEEDALAVALGFEPAVRPAQRAQPEPAAVEETGGKTLEDPATLAAKAEKQRRKEERRKRREEKRERKELKRARRLDKGPTRDGGRRVKDEPDGDYDARRRHATLSRSRSPRRTNHSRRRSSSRSPSYDGGGYHSRHPRDANIHRLDGRLRTEDRKPWKDRDVRRDRSTDRW